MMNPIRESARALRLRIDAGERLDLDEAVSHCVTMAEALTAFDRTEEDEEGTRVFCCGKPATITSGIFGAKVDCPTCGAHAVDATSPMFSPLLERGNAYITVPSEEWCAKFGERNWLVMHEGDRP
ncbi:MAG TPA: hypothetical protein VGK73_19170 [Polyangiaceae bacterium]